MKKRASGKWIAAVTGREDGIDERYRALYGESSWQECAKREQRSTLQKYLTVLIFAGLLAAIVVSGVLQPDVSTRTSSDGLLLSVQRPARDRGAVTLDATVSAVSGNGSARAAKQLVIEPRGSKEETNQKDVLPTETEDDRLQRSISAAVSRLNDDTSEATVVLPQQLEDGTKLYWQQRQENHLPVVLLVCLLLLAAVYRGRHQKLEREEAAARADVVRQLPGFLNKLLLMLGAGVVLNTAFDRVLEGRRRVCTEDGYFYGQLQEIYLRTHEMNSALHLELAEFAQRSGVREWMRLTGIITDSMARGTDLSRRLQRESSLLWFSRRKRAEELSRLAETKMTLPLVILLLVLVMITIAPVMLDM
ncbi:MAG: type II secretion system F family protein [Anaerovoracaceae bacterium]